MYTTETIPADSRPIVSAFLVWACGDDLDDALKELEKKAKDRSATEIIGLRITMADGTYYVPGTSFVGGGTTQRDMGSQGYSAGRKSWTVYGTAVRRRSIEDFRRTESEAFSQALQTLFPSTSSPPITLPKRKSR